MSARMTEKGKRMTKERLSRLLSPYRFRSTSEDDEVTDELHRARTSEATLTTQLRAQDEALRVAQEALEAYLKEPSLKRTLQHGRASQGLVDAERKARATLAAIAEATRV